MFIEIGRLCYDENRDNPGESYAPLFDELKAMDESHRNYARGA